MPNQNWKMWLAPFGLWALYLCWYSGYQSGYADGHETAWHMALPSPLAIMAETPPEFREAKLDLERDAVIR